MQYAHANFSLQLFVFCETNKSQDKNIELYFHSYRKHAKTSSANFEKEKKNISFEKKDTITN